MIIRTCLKKKKNKKKKKPTKDDLIALNKRIIDEEIDINEKLFKKYFKIQRPSDMFKYLKKQMIKRKAMD